MDLVRGELNFVVERRPVGHLGEDVGGFAEGTEFRRRGEGCGVDLDVGQSSSESIYQHDVRGKISPIYHLSGEVYGLRVAGGEVHELRPFLHHTVCGPIRCIGPLEVDELVDQSV